MHAGQGQAGAVGGTEPVEHLEQLELVVDVVLEPEHDLAATGSLRQRVVASRQLAACVHERRPATAREERRAKVTQASRVEIARDRPDVERIAPGKDGAAEP